MEELIKMYDYYIREAEAIQITSVNDYAYLQECKKLIKAYEKAIKEFFEEN